MSLLQALADWGAPAACTVLVLLCVRAPETAGRCAAAIWRWRWPVLLATRLLWPVLVHSFLHLGNRSDLGWRGQRSRWFLEGQVPGVDYPNFHAPLIPYLEGAGRWLVPGNPPWASLLLFLAGDVAAVLLGARLARRWGERAEAWVGAWLLLTPLLWSQTGIRGQDEAIFTAALAAALLAAARGRDLLAGGVLGIGLCATKVTFAPYAAAILVALGPRRWRASAAFVAAAAVVAGAYALTGARPFASEQVRRHVSNFGAGMGIPDTLHRLFPGYPLKAALLTYAAAVGAAVLLVPWLRRRDDVEARALRSVVAVHAVSMLAMPLCVAPYFAQGLVPVLLLMAAPWAARSRVLPWALPAAALLCVLQWTRWPAVTMPVKPAMILLHGALLVMALRAAGGPVSGAEAPAPASGTDPDR